MSMFSSTFLVLSNSVGGRATYGALSVLGFGDVVWPFMTGTGSPQMDIALSMSSTVTSQFLMRLLATYSLKRVVEGYTMILWVSRATLALFTSRFVKPVLFWSTVDKRHVL